MDSTDAKTVTSYQLMDYAEARLNADAAFAAAYKFTLMGLRTVDKIERQRLVNLGKELHNQGMELIPKMDKLMQEGRSGDVT